MRIRTATVADAPRLIELWTAAGLKFRPDDVPAELEAVLARDNDLVLVAPAEHIALGYKQLLEVERDFRHLKADDLNLRLVFHRLEYRVRQAFDLIGTPIPLTMR